MKRFECIQILAGLVDRPLVVTTAGGATHEWWNFGDNAGQLPARTLGLCSSIGLGLARSLPNERVVVLDGDGSVLMNLGTFVTLARYRPANMIHVVFDNGSLLSTGGFDSQTASGTTDIAAIARGAGIEHVAAVSTTTEFGEAFVEALERHDLSVIVAKVAAVGPEHYGMDLQLPENAFRFKRWIAERKRGAGQAS